MEAGDRHEPRLTFSNVRPATWPLAPHAPEDRPRKFAGDKATVITGITVGQVEEAAG
jgi:hypothetical protein